MPTYRITIDGHRCRAITADSWREALAVAICRAYGPRAWAPPTDINGHSYIDTYQSPTRLERRYWGDGSPQIARNAAVTIIEA